MIEWTLNALFSLTKTTLKRMSTYSYTPSLLLPNFSASFLETKLKNITCFCSILESSTCSCLMCEFSVCYCCRGGFSTC